MKTIYTTLTKVNEQDIVNGTVIIPDNITIIGKGAFAYLENLKSIVIPNSVTKIEDNAFEDCKSLESIVIPNSVTSIGDDAFSCCKNLESIVIPNSVTIIEQYTFASCEKLDNVVIPNTVEKIRIGAFYNCKNLRNIIISDNVQWLGESAFSYCKNLKKITLPNKITCISPLLFYDCINLEDITIPNSVTMIFHSAFENCESLRSITIPNNVKCIDVGAFESCRNLRRVIVPPKTCIGSNAFYGCHDDLKIIRVPFTLNINNNHVKEKALEQKQPIVPMDKVNDILNEIQNYITNLKNLEIKPLNSESATTIEPFASELNDYPMIISSAYYSSQSLDPNLNNRNKKLNKLLNQISGNDRQSLLEKIENMFLKVQDGEIVLNKDAMKQLKNFSDSELEMLKRQNQILSKLKEMSKLYSTKLKGCLNELDTNFISDIDDEMEKSDMKSLNNAVQIKMASLNKQLLTMSITHDQINNAINSNILYMTSLNEVTTILLPSIIGEVANNKLVIRKQESIETIKQVANILKQAQNKPMEINTSLEEVKTSMK